MNDVLELLDLNNDGLFPTNNPSALGPRQTRKRAPCSAERSYHGDTQAHQAPFALPPLTMMLLFNEPAVITTRHST